MPLLLYWTHFCNPPIFALIRAAGKTLIATIIENLIYETLWTGTGSGLLISMLEKLNWFCLTGLITLALLEEKSFFKMAGVEFLFWIGLGLLHYLYC